MDSIDTFFICQVFVKMMKWTLKYYFWIFMPREFNACLAIKQVDKQKIVKKINERDMSLVPQHFIGSHAIALISYRGAWWCLFFSLNILMRRLYDDSKLFGRMNTLGAKRKINQCNEYNRGHLKVCVPLFHTIYLFALFSNTTNAFLFA